MTTSLSEMCFVTPELLNCIRKLDITLSEKEDEYAISINWDKDDPELEPWMVLTEEEQTDFILACFNSQLTIEE